MCSMLSCSSGTVVIATAMVFSSTALFLAVTRQFQSSKIQDQTPPPILRSSLSSEEKKKQRKKKKKKKVQFAENVKDTTGNGKEYRMRSRRIEPKPLTKPENTGSICKTSNIPANRMALYNGILRDRDHRIQSFY